MPSIADQLRAAGSALNPQNLGLTQQLFAAEMPREPYAGVAVERDRRYGPHERHLGLEVFVVGGLDLVAVLDGQPSGHVGHVPITERGGKQDSQDNDVAPRSIN